MEADKLMKVLDKKYEGLNQVKVKAYKNGT